MWETSLFNEKTGVTFSAKLKVPRLRTGAVPTKLPYTPSYLSSAGSSRESPDARRKRKKKELIKSALEKQKQDDLVHQQESRLINLKADLVNIKTAKPPAHDDHPAEVMKPPHVDVQVVEVKEEPTWTEEAQDMLQQDPLALNPEPVSWQSSDSQEEPQPQGRVVYLKEEIDIKEEDVDSFSMEEVAECVTDRGGSLLQGPQEETEKLPVKRRKAMKAELVLSATPRVKTRKVDFERRVFKPSWEKYFFVERFGRAQCLICFKTVAVLKEYNVRRHWEAEHRSSNFASMSATERKDVVVRLSGDLQKTTLHFPKGTVEADKVTRASYEVSRLLARRMKPFTDGDYIKECLVAVVDSVCPEQRYAFESVNLSSHTVRRRIEEMADNVHDSLKTRCSTLVAFSLALDESTNTKDTAQLAVFIHGVTADLQVCEEFLQLVPLHGTTTGQDIFDAVLQCVAQHSLDLSRLVCVTTNGTRAMIGEKGAASLLVRHCEAAGHTQPIHKVHCIFHQEALCAKSANLVDVMSVVVKVVNSILSHSLNHRQFQVLMDEVNAHYNDLLYFREVHWLSRGTMLSHVCDLQQEIATFLRQKNLPHADHFSNPRWLARLALLTDITTHLNTLNVKLQDKDILVTDMYTHITTFEVKLRFWEAQLAIGQFVHFPRLAACAPDDVDLGTCVSVIASLREEFAFHFTGVRPLAANFRLFTAPFDFPVDDAPAHLQMELVELQCNDELKAKFHTSSPLSFFRDLVLPSSNFPKYVAHVQHIVAMFGSTYCCEELFSKVKYMKSHLHSHLSDRHLNNILLLSTSSIEPDIETLIHGKQHRPSH
ncbi:general transcription factor II-I repeat domain-containing protein 2-like [Eriocheir sinensis]|uniref:general transcription factor II-I repeat domain-containing protein 2-like n=1 Tax=Eriocheir sinensis TaxID=95602 RepID=UPI0021C5D2A1|nr:general transcription factor II-I repeat domain-containing protein 2-like [Eriocheir sinensis]